MTSLNWNKCDVQIRKTGISKGMLGRITLLFSLTLAGCQSIASDDLKLALLESANQNAKLQIKQIILQDFGTRELKIADDAFLNQSSITIMKQVRRTLENSNLQGRDMQTPKRYKLMKSGSNCYLVSDSNSKTWKLTDVTCRYE